MKEILKDRYRDSLITISGEKYVDIDVFEDVAKEATTYYCLLGILAKKLGRIAITDKEIERFVDNDFFSIDIIKENNQYIINKTKTLEKL